MDCALFCFARSTCKSYTFDKQKCFLFENNYGKTKLNTLTTDIRKQHWNIAKGCRQQLCQPDEYCVSYDKCSYACLKLAINCGLPESVLNAKYFLPTEFEMDQSRFKMFTDLIVEVKRKKGRLAFTNRIINGPKQICLVYVIILRLLIIPV
ncbi:unnamed protein product [Acanthosepion pharaonis]|uniref:Apple domain-containing protein n=1 Tax=Acanthosepion pharaonis TaxID=158019 RepID=A0A812CVZ5_ACAPH|nr:unnamed protein product [Sepia pharaonis]